MRAGGREEGEGKEVDLPGLNLSTFQINFIVQSVRARVWPRSSTDFATPQTIPAAEDGAGAGWHGPVGRAAASVYR